MADFDDGRTPTQEELQQMFSVPSSKGELLDPQRPPSGRQLSSGAELLITEPVTARKVEVYRDEAKILQKLASIAAFAGNEVLTYRWPVKDRRSGKVKTVTGPTIKCAYAIARCYGNSRTDVAAVDVGGSWIFKAVFTDLEAGVQTSRLFQQHKGVAKIGGDDDARRLDMSFQIGQSKAIRNVIVAHLELPFVNYMLEVADEKLVEKIGANVVRSRERIGKQLADAEIPLARVERIIGKPLSGWLAPDIARVWQELKGVLDGMTDPADVWPVEAPPEPRRSDMVDSASQSSANASSSDSAATAGAEGGGAVAASPADLGASSSPSQAADDSAPKRIWSIGDDVVGQDAVIQRLHELASVAFTEADLDAIETQNAERIAKVTGTKGAALKKMLADRRLVIKES